MANGTQTSELDVMKVRGVGLASLLDRISKTEGPINPNDKAVARIYAGYMLTQEPRNRRKTDREPPKRTR